MKEGKKSPNYKHGILRSGHIPREYWIWKEMKRRCLNSKSKSFEYYGARGITVCERWKEFKNFYEDMGPAPQKMTLERNNNSISEE